VADSISSNCFGGTGRWYRGDLVGSEGCVRDCNSVDDVTSLCGGLVEDSYVVFHNSVEACCSAEFGWMTKDICTTRSSKTTTDKYWPDQINGRCFKDADKPAKDLGIPLFSSASECCLTSIGWISEATCVSASGISANGTDKFFLHWQSEQCVKDCVGPAPCKGLAQSWDRLYQTETLCCNMIPWTAREDCMYTDISKTSQGAGEMALEATGRVYYPDWRYQSGTCLNDGNEPIYMQISKGSVSNSLEECCDQHYSGWNKNKCMSGGGPE
jgi:hypothetical protein